jgi:hypothetical protein
MTWDHFAGGLITHPQLQEGSAPQEEPGSRLRRACVWSSGDISRQPPRAKNRPRQCAGEDRIVEPRVQHPPPRNLEADDCRIRAKSACAVRNTTSGEYRESGPASDDLSISRRSARTDDPAAKTPLFEVPLGVNKKNSDTKSQRSACSRLRFTRRS